MKTKDPEKSPETAISVRRIEKAYRIWQSPSKRLISPFLRECARLFPENSTASRKLREKSKSYYRDFFALRDINFKIEKGESVGIIGRNGSGKTTLLEIIAGTLQPTRGEVQTRGRVAALLELGSGFNYEFTGRENVYLTASIHGLSGEEIEERFESILDFAEIGDFIDQPLKTYSSGMVVRLAFAVNALLDPDILIIDEALAVGDIFFQQKCFRRLKNELKGKTRLLVAHDLYTLSSVTERIIVLNAGKIIFDGDTSEGIACYTKVLVDETYAGKETIKVPKIAFESAFDGERDLPWVDAGPKMLSGRKEVIIKKAALTDANKDPVFITFPGELSIIHAVIEVKKAPLSIICGYMVHDKFGKDICGETNFPLENGRYTIEEPGKYYYRIKFRWPYLKPADYTMTIGVGEGEHVHNHIIQCWAHNIFKVTAASPEFEIHGLFANPMEEFEIEKFS